MAKRATHKGTCQCCGSPQKLPGGVLSLHGYTRPDGWFEGVCQGAGHLPFEQSKDLIEEFIAGAQASLESTFKMIEEFRVRQATPLIQVMTGEVYRREYVKVWREVEITLEEGVPMLSYVDPRKGQVKERADRKGYAYGLYKATTDQGKLDCVYDELAQARLRNLTAGVGALRHYIEWQQDRIKDWAPKELVAL